MTCIGKKHITGTFNGRDYDKTKIFYTLQTPSCPEGVEAGSFTITNDEASKLSVGDSFRVSYNRFGRPVMVIVE